MAKRKTRRRSAGNRTTLRAAAIDHTTLAGKLARALGALAKDLPNPASESDDYFHPFAVPMAAATPLTPESLKQALRVGDRYQMTLRPADAFLEGGSDPDNWGEEVASGFQLLTKVLRATLTDVSVANARAPGVVRVRLWLFGRDSNGTLVGLRSMSTET